MKHGTDEGEESTPKKYRKCDDDRDETLPTRTTESESKGTTSSSSVGGSTAVTPSPRVLQGISHNRGGTEEEVQNPPSRALWKSFADHEEEGHDASVDERLGGSSSGGHQRERETTACSKEKVLRQQQQQLNVDGMMKQTSSKPPPRHDEIVAFKSHTVYPPRQLSDQETGKALEHLRLHCLAPASLHIKTSDRIVLTRRLSDNLVIGTTGTVKGWRGIGEVRIDLTRHITQVKSHPQEFVQLDYETDVSHKHAVDATPSPWYPVVKFDGREGVEEERTVLPEAFHDTVPDGQVGRLIRCQLPLLRVPNCRCRRSPAGSPARLLRCHNHGPNHGRWFFGCAGAIGEQCGYFVWKTAKADSARTPSPSKVDSHEE